MGGLLPSLRRAIEDGFGALLPDGIRELGERLAKAPLNLNDYGYDPYGLHPNRSVISWRVVEASAGASSPEGEPASLAHRPCR